MTISVPDELRSRMQRWDEITNWSGVAAQAFEAEIARQAMLATVTDETKRRLLARGASDEAEVTKEGYDAGVRWGRDRATMRQLRKLAKKDEAMTDCDLLWDNLEAFAQAVSGEDATWRNNIIDDTPDDVDIEDGWLGGFVEGALDVLKKVSG
jgi:hypothetical protein